MEDQIVLLKSKCNRLIDMINALQEENQKLENQLHAMPDSAAGYVDAERTSGGWVSALPEIRQFSEFFEAVLLECREKHLILPFTDRSQFSAEYVKVESKAFERIISNRGIEKEDFLSCCVLLNLIGRDQKSGKRTYSNGNDRIYMLKKHIVESILTTNEKAAV